MDSKNYDKLVKDVDAAADEDDTKASTGSEFKEFPQLKNFLARFIKSHPSMKTNDKDINRLIVEVLKIAHHCALFGYYTSDKNVVELVDALLPLLDCENDFENLPSAVNKRALPRELSKANMKKDVTKFDPSAKKPAAYNDVKMEGLQILQIINNLYVRRRLFGVLYLFKSKKGEYILSRLTGVASKETNVGSLENDLKEIEIVAKANHLGGKGKLREVLRTLASFHDERVKLLALRLLDRRFSLHEELFSFMERVQVGLGLLCHSHICTFIHTYIYIHSFIYNLSSLSFYSRYLQLLFSC